MYTLIHTHTPELGQVLHAAFLTLYALILAIHKIFQFTPNFSLLQNSALNIIFPSHIPTVLHCEILKLTYKL